MAQDVVVSLGPHPTADFICDGVADDVEINAAIEEAERRGCDVRLLRASYNTVEPIRLRGTVKVISVDYV